MTLWEVKPSNHPCLISSNSHYSYNDVHKHIEKISQLISNGVKEKRLVALLADNSPESIIKYLVCLNLNYSVILIDKNLNIELLNSLLNTYKPDLIWDNAESIVYGLTNCLMLTMIGFGNIYKTDYLDKFKLNPDLAVLLSTSGSTGCPKLVRLTYKNIEANAKSISEYLELTNSEIAITSLPIFYSFGLSIINSHLKSNGTLVCTDESVSSRSFWEDFNKFNCTSFAGVPFSYQILKTLKFDRMKLSSLRYMTQAGGRLNPEDQKYFNCTCKNRGIKFFVMYGATEATARISYVPPDKLDSKYGSIGVAIPDGKLLIVKDGKEVKTAKEEGEICYIGPNVMLGYADCREDLLKGDELNGTLLPGDVGYQDEDGFFYVTGRTKRFAKLFGLRINLDDIEKKVEEFLGTLVACTSDDIKINIYAPNKYSNKDILSYVETLYQINRNYINLMFIEEIPITSSGKKDYKKLS